MCDKIYSRVEGDGGYSPLVTQRLSVIKPRVERQAIEFFPRY